MRQENLSFDHYFGYARQVQAKGFGPPAGYSEPDAGGGRHAPYHLTSLTSPDIPHDWDSVHRQWDGGRMDGFYLTDGDNGLGYYIAGELPFYYNLFRSSALCANYFCSLLGPTWLSDVGHLGPLGLLDRGIAELANLANRQVRGLRGEREDPLGLRVLAALALAGRAG